MRLNRVSLAGTGADIVVSSDLVELAKRERFVLRNISFVLRRNN